MPFFDLGNLSLAGKLWIFRARGEMPSGEIVLPRNSKCLTPKKPFFNCQFQSCLAKALKNCPNVAGKIRTIIGCKPNVIHALSTLISLDNCVQLLAHEGGKGRYRSAKSFCKSPVGKGSAGEIECKHFRWPSVRHRQNSYNPESNQACRKEIYLPSVVLHLRKSSPGDYC